MAVSRVEVYRDDNDVEHKTLKLLASKHYRTWIGTEDAFSKALASGKILPGTVCYITDDTLDINGDYYTKDQVDDMLSEFEERYNTDKAALEERITSDETTIASHTTTLNTHTTNINSLSSGKLNIPTSSAVSNRFMIATANGTTTYWRDLSTIRATASGGILYLYDN